MAMSKSEMNSLDTFSNFAQTEGVGPSLFLHNCPTCRSETVKPSHQYQTQHNGKRTIYVCQDCGTCFSETYGTPIAGLTTPLSEIVKVLKARMEGLGLNAAARVFGFSKNTILNWERRLSALQETLFLYALVHEFLQLIIEGDELYTKVKRNEQASDSQGWTIVLMERASRFILKLKCGRKDRRLFLEAVATLSELFEQSESLALFTDGERRYSQLVFAICHEVLQDGKRGRPRKVLPKGMRMRLKNKSSKRRDSKGKLKKVEIPKPEHPETECLPEENQVHANHIEAFNSSLRRCLSAFRRRTNTYAKTVAGLQRVLDIFWIVHNFVKPHFTTRTVPAVGIGILEKGLSWEDLFRIRILC
jgi:transposase-like protein/IS1 family transposase